MTDENVKMNPPPHQGGGKIVYTNKKDAKTKLNFLLRNPYCKKRPLRVYEDSTGWHLTKLELVDNISLVDLLSAAIKYSESKRYTQSAVHKRCWEQERILRNKLKRYLHGYR